MDHTDYPSVTLDGLTLYFKLSFAALRRLKTAGIDANKPPDPADLDASAEYTAKWVSACGYVKENGKLKYAKLSVDEVEELLDMRNVQSLVDALAVAMVKAPPAETSPAQPAAS